MRLKRILAAASVAVVIGAPEWMRPGQTLQAREVLGELARSLLMAYVLARWEALSRPSSWRAAFALGGWVWLGFQAAILSGSLIHEHMPWTEYGTRAGYALASVLSMIAVLGFKGFAPTRVQAGAEMSSGRSGINYKAIPVAAIAAIVVGAVWYSPALFGGAWANLKASASTGGSQIPPVEIAGELVRSCIVAYTVARLVTYVRITKWSQTLLLGGWAWLGFHQTLLLFSVVHQQMP